MKPIKKPRARRAAAALELALLLPPLCLLALGSLDVARMLFAYTTITNCARNGALHASDATAAVNSPYSSYQQAAIVDGSSLSPALATTDVSMSTGSDGYGSYVDVTVTYKVASLSNLLSSSTSTLSRTVRMRVVPASPG